MKGRYKHGSITIGQETMIIGGYSSDEMYDYLFLTL